MALPGYPADERILQRRAVEALTNVGDAAAGEWHEWTGTAYHIRRRLTTAEAALVGPAVDVRGTPEADRRWATVARYLPPAWQHVRE